MHVVLGTGEMPRKALTETLADLWKKDEDAGQTFWFLLQGKSDPTDTDKALVAWLEKNEIYYELLTDDTESMDEVYTQSQETHVAKRMGQKVVNLMQSKPEEGETAELLALFAGDPGDEVDAWLNSIIKPVFEAEFPVRALNDGLADVDLGKAPAATSPDA